MKPCIRRNSEILSTEIALNWIRTSLKSGILYTGRLENVYDPGFFDLIRTTERVQVFPVTFTNSADLPLFGPIPNAGSKPPTVQGFTHGSKDDVTESLMLSAMAVNIEYLKNEVSGPLR